MVSIVTCLEQGEAGRPRQVGDRFGDLADAQAAVYRDATLQWRRIRGGWRALNRGRHVPDEVWADWTAEADDGRPRYVVRRDHDPAAAPGQQEAGG
jgi:hypothetical protein